MIEFGFTSRWPSERLGVLFTENTNRNSDFAVQTAYQFYFGAIIPKKYFDLTEELINTYKKYTVVQPGDIMINGLNLNYDFVTQRVGLVKNNGIITSAYLSIRPKVNISETYYAYLLKTVDAMKIFHGLGTGIRKTLAFSDLKNFVLPVPPREEQDQIVRYLDWQASKINKLIAAKRKQIALNKERTQVLVSDLVIHGLSKDVATKESGVDWIGKIPSNWEVLRCKYLFSERDERSKDGSETHLSMSQKYGLIPDSELDERRMLSASYAGGKLCYENDLVLNRLKAHLGIFALAPQLGVISPDYTVLIPNTKRIVPQYAEAVLKSDLCRKELRIRVRGIIEGFWRLYTDDFYTIKLPLPPIDEQKEIMSQVSVIHQQAKAFEAAIQNEIDVLSEMRNRLISDVVTGQIDVRGIEIPEYEYVEEMIDDVTDDADISPEVDRND